MCRKYSKMKLKISFDYLFFFFYIREHKIRKIVQFRADVNDPIELMFDVSYNTRESNIKRTTRKYQLRLTQINSSLDVKFILVSWITMQCGWLATATTFCFLLFLIQRLDRIRRWYAARTPQTVAVFSFLNKQDTSFSLEALSHILPKQFNVPCHRVFRVEITWRVETCDLYNTHVQ